MLKGLFVISPQLKVLYVNSWLSQTLGLCGRLLQCAAFIVRCSGYSPQAPRSRFVMDLIHPDLQSKVPLNVIPPASSTFAVYTASSRTADAQRKSSWYMQVYGDMAKLLSAEVGRVQHHARIKCHDGSFKRCQLGLLRV